MLSGGKYAVFTHRGTFLNLFKTYQYICWHMAANNVKRKNRITGRTLKYMSARCDHLMTRIIR
ncbi:MAG: GyrI-like domain-containing protein [[Clostridium] scindens]